MNYNETFFNMMVYYFFAKGVFELSVSIKNEIIGEYRNYRGWKTYVESEIETNILNTVIKVIDSDNILINSITVDTATKDVIAYNQSDYLETNKYIEPIDSLSTKNIKCSCTEMCICGMCKDVEKTEPTPSFSKFSKFDIEPEKDKIINTEDDDFPVDNYYFQPKNFVRLERTNKTIGFRSDTPISVDKKVCGPWFQSSRAGVLEIDLENKLDPFKSYNNIDLEPVKAYPNSVDSKDFNQFIPKMGLTSDLSHLIIPNSHNSNLNSSEYDFIENQHLTSEIIHKLYDEELKKELLHPKVELTPKVELISPKIIPCSLLKIMGPSTPHICMPSSERTAILRLIKPKLKNMISIQVV